MKTNAKPNGDGSFSVNGTKIFISAGEHDLTENIVHIVLAKLPDAPKGTKGLFIYYSKILHRESGEVENAMGFIVVRSKRWGFMEMALPSLNLTMPKGF